MENTNTSVVEIKKQQYLAYILNTIYFKGAVSIAQLAKGLHTSVPTVTQHINDLLEVGWLIDLGTSKTKSGRRPNLYDLNSEKNPVLVVDISQIKTTLVHINSRNEILERKQINILAEDKDYVVKLNQEIQTFIADKVVWAIGISSIGLLNVETGVNHTYPNQILNGQPLHCLLSSTFKCPVYMIHDTQASLIGEYHFGLAKDLKNVLLINMDWGIGMGILSNGEIMKGADGFAGELGHIQVKPDGKLCVCGKKGCLETVASAEALIQNVKEGLKAGKSSTLNHVQGEIHLEDIVKAAANGDEFSIDLIFEISRELGKALAMAVHMFNPEKIIIDGSLTEVDELILTTINQAINKYCIREFKQNMKILISPMGEKAKVLGAKSYVYENMIREKRF